MDALNQGAVAINKGIAYLKLNAWPIAFLLGLYFFLKPKVIAAVEDAKTSRSPQQIKDHDRDLRRVRQMQQMQAEQDAKIKAKLLAEKKAAEKLEKSTAKEEADEKKKAKITTTSKPKEKPAVSLSMNSFSTPSYRPQRRTVRRG